MNTTSEVEALASLIGNKMILRTSTAEIAQAVLDAGYSKGCTATPDPAGVSEAAMSALHAADSVLSYIRHRGEFQSLSEGTQQQLNDALTEVSRITRRRS